MSSKDKAVSSSKKSRAKKRSQAVIMTIKDRIFNLLMNHTTTKELYAIMYDEYQMPPRTVENHRATVLKEMYEEYKKNHAKTIIEALMRKQEYINFWKEKYNETEKPGYMARAEASEDGLNELKFRTNILPDASKPHIQINQQTNNTEVKPDIDVLLAALKADKTKTITVKPETSEKSEG